MAPKIPASLLLLDHTSPHSEFSLRALFDYLKEFSSQPVLIATPDFQDGYNIIERVFPDKQLKPSSPSTGGVGTPQKLAHNLFKLLFDPEMVEFKMHLGALLKDFPVILILHCYTNPQDEMTKRLISGCIRSLCILSSPAKSPWELPRLKAGRDRMFVLPGAGAPDQEYIREFQKLSDLQPEILSPALVRGDQGVRSIARRLLGRTFGVALGGGGARGLAHIGVLEVLKEHNIEIDELTGTSMGAYVASSYAVEQDPERIKEHFMTHWISTPFNPLWDRKIPFTQGTRKIRTAKLLMKLLGENRLTFETTLPFRAITTDLRLGEEFIPVGSRLWESVKASANLPFVFKPYPLLNRLLVDGGLVNNVPANWLSNGGVDHVLAVNVGHNIEKNPFSKDSPWAVLGRIFKIFMNQANMIYRRNTDLEIWPDMEEFGTYDYSKGEKIIEVGRRATLEYLPALKEKLNPNIEKF